MRGGSVLRAGGLGLGLGRVGMPKVGLGLGRVGLPGLGLGRVGVLASGGLPLVVGLPRVARAPQVLANLSTAAQAVDSAMADSIAAARPIPRHLMGGFWMWVVPIVIFLVATAATLALYRRFARERDELEAAARAREG